jgi:hypothetical protein
MGVTASFEDQWPVHVGESRGVPPTPGALVEHPFIHETETKSSSVRTLTEAAEATPPKGALVP